MPWGEHEHSAVFFCPKVLGLTVFHAFQISSHIKRTGANIQARILLQKNPKFFKVFFFKMLKSLHNRYIRKEKNYGKFR